VAKPDRRNRRLRARHVAFEPPFQGIHAEMEAAPTVARAWIAYGGQRIGGADFTCKIDTRGCDAGFGGRFVKRSLSNLPFAREQYRGCQWSLIVHRYL
jgi:hypothetical protein